MSQPEFEGMPKGRSSSALAALLLLSAAGGASRASAAEHKQISQPEAEALFVEACLLEEQRSAALCQVFVETPSVRDAIHTLRVTVLNICENRTNSIGDCRDFLFGALFAIIATTLSTEAAP